MAKFSKPLHDDARQVFAPVVLDRYQQRLRTTADALFSRAVRFLSRFICHALLAALHRFSVGIRAGRIEYRQDQVLTRIYRLRSPIAGRGCG